MTITAFANAKNYNWAEWVIGIMRSFISGGSASMVAGLTSMGIAPGTFNLTNSIGNTFKLMGVMFLFQGGYRMFEFLQLHGAPDRIQETLAAAADAATEAKKQVEIAKTQLPKDIAVKE